MLALPNFKLTAINKLYALLLFILLSSCLQSFAYADNTEKMANFIPIPAQQSYLTFNREGEIYLLEEPKSHLRTVLSLSNQLNLKQILLFDVAVHPSFTLENKPGYGLFYTAYRIPFNRYGGGLNIDKKSPHSRFELVISEWKYHHADQRIEVDSQREIYRIASDDEQFKIKQLTFNPSLQPWHADYGLLHILLNKHKDKASALFSGSLLRINPAPFGLKQYTVPLGNPFLQSNDVSPEIVLYNIEQPDKLVWQKNVHQDFLIHHFQASIPSISTAMNGDSLENHQPTYQFLASERRLFEALLPYNSHQIDGGPVYLGIENNQVIEVSFADNQVVKQVIELTKINDSEQQFDQHVIVQATHSNIHMFDYSQQKMIKVKVSQQLKDEAQIYSPTPSYETGKGTLVLLYLSVVIFIALLIWLNRDKLVEAHAKRKIRQQYGKVNIIDNMVCLYNRHHEDIALKLEPKHIKLSEVFLNQQLVNQVDNKQLAFSHQAEVNIKGVFNREYHLKMYGKRLRQIQILLTDKRGKKYWVCPYFRIGEQRYTRLHFKPSLMELVDFQWQISTLINAANTGERKYENIPDPEALKPAKSADVVTSSSLQQKIEVSPQQTIAETNHASSEIKSKEDVVEQQLTHSQDASIINALEKLVILHQQGFLSDGEFSQAKAKLLQSLVDQ